MRWMMAAVLVCGLAAASWGATYYPPTKTERTTTLTPIGNTGYSLSKLEQLKYALTPIANDPGHYELYEQGWYTCLHRNSDGFEWAFHDTSVQEKPLPLLTSEWGPAHLSRDFSDYGHLWNDYPADVRAVLTAACADSDQDGRPDEWDPSPAAIIQPPNEGGGDPTGATDQAHSGGGCALGAHAMFHFDYWIGDVHRYTFDSQWAGTGHCVQTQGPGWLVYVIYYGDGRVDRGSSGPAPNKWKDDDGDGIPNGDEVAPPPPPVDPNPPTTQPLPDADGDGFPDSVEDDFGTNPNDPQSNPATNYPGGPGWTPTVGDEGTDDGAASPSTQPSAEDISSAEAELNAVLNQLYGQLRAMGLDATPYQVHGDIPN